jgi:hypothetical protein
MQIIRLPHKNSHEKFTHSLHNEMEKFLTATGNVFSAFSINLLLFYIFLLDFNCLFIDFPVGLLQLADTKVLAK